MTQTVQDKQAYESYFARASTQHRLRYEWIVDTFLDDVQGERICEVGCGDGGVVQCLREDNDVVGVDISSAGIDQLTNMGIDAHLVDISSEPLPFDDAWFDTLIIFEVFEHLANPHHAVEEIQRVVRAGGRVLISIPNPRTGHPYIYPELLRFGAFKRYLRANGFTLVRTVPYGLCPPLWRLLRPLVFHPRRLAQSTKAVSTLGGTVRAPWTTRLARAASGPLATRFKPARYAWLLVYELLNDDPEGARGLFDQVAAQTSGAYER